MAKIPDDLTFREVEEAREVSHLVAGKVNNILRAMREQQRELDELKEQTYPILTEWDKLQQEEMIEDALREAVKSDSACEHDADAQWFGSTGFTDGKCVKCGTDLTKLEYPKEDKPQECIDKDGKHSPNYYSDSDLARCAHCGQKTASGKHVHGWGKPVSTYYTAPTERKVAGTFLNYECKCGAILSDPKEKE